MDDFYGEKDYLTKFLAEQAQAFDVHLEYHSAARNHEVSSYPCEG